MVSQFERELRSAAHPRSLSQLAALGVTRAMVRGPRWRQTSRGCYVPVDAAPTPTQRILDAAPLIPNSGAITGWAAAYTHGVDALDGLDPDELRPQKVTICLGRDTGRLDLSGVAYVRDRLSADEVAIVAGLRVTSALRATVDGVRRAPSLVEAVVFLDMAAAACIVELGDVGGWCNGHSGLRGLRKIDRALRLADRDSASPWETSLRMFYMLRACLPRPLVNRPVFNIDGKFLGKPDLLDPDAGLACEFDGQDHRQRRQHRNDNLREEGLEEANLVVSRVDSLDLRYPMPLIDRLRAAHARGLARDRGRDRWTIHPPAWWLRRRAA
jgi:hypothetical protein